MAETTATMNIYQKLAKIRKSVEIMKRDTKAFGYSYTKEESILAKITVYMDKYNLSLVPGIVPGTTTVTPYTYKKTKSTQKGDIYEETVNEVLVAADTTWTWINNDNPEERIVVPWSIKKYGIRNAKLLSVAPTGTMSIVFGNNCSSGIEPIFQTSYLRKIKMGGQSDDDAVTVEIRDYGYWLWSKLKEEMGEDAVFSEDVFRTALDIDVLDHLHMLASIAYHVDMSVSKTINIPEEYSFGDTMDVYLDAWMAGIKGCTIFRPNSLRSGILIQKDSEKKPENTAKISTEDKEALPRGTIVGVNEDLVSIKKTIVNGCGKFYLHVDFDEKTGSPWETWIDIGSGGGCERNQQFISRLISLALRGGIPIESIIDQALSVHPCTAYMSRSIKRGDTSVGTSCPSAIGYALKDIMERIRSGNVISGETERKPKQEEGAVCDSCDACTSKCPECGEPIDFEGGCMVCRSCGWSKCS